MAVFSGTEIVSGGLVLHLDAANPKSYPGSGTTWADLSGNGNNGALINGVGYNTDNKGLMTFDGSNDFVDFFAPNLTTIATVEMWAKIGAGYSNKMFMGWFRYDIFCGGGALGFNTAGGDVYGISSTTVSNLGVVENWKQYIFEMRSDVAYSNNKIYINGAPQSLSQQNGSENSANRNFNNGNGRIAVWKADTRYCMPMDCSSFKIYNRALTAAEIRQNFEAKRSRYGI